MKAVIFDLDGTTLYTLEDLNDALNYSLREYGYNEVSLEDTKKYIGNGIRMLIIRAAKEEKNADLMFDKFKQYYTKNCNNHTRPYEGIIEIMKFLKNKGIKVGIVSNKARYALEILVEAHFENLVDYIVGDGEGYKRKPDPEALFICANKLGATMDETYYVGDSDVDAKTIINAKCHGILVSYGYRSKEELENAGAKIIVSSTKELDEYLRKCI